MALYDDIVSITGVDNETTQLFNGNLIPVSMSSGVVEDLNSVRDLLPEVLTYAEEDIELTSGQYASVYGSEAEKIVLCLIDDSDVVYVHCFKYETLEDYASGLSTQTPSTEARA